VNPVRDCTNMRTDFIDRALNPVHVQFCDGMVHSSRQQGDGLFPPDWNGRQVAEDMQHTMKMAEMWTITPEMHHLISVAAQSMPPETLDRYDLPSQQGFLWLPEPLCLTDVRQERLNVQGILWSEREIGRPGENPGRGVPEVTRGVVIHLFTVNGHPDDPMMTLKALDPEKYQNVMANTPSLSLIHSMSIAFNRLAWDLDTSEMEGVSPDDRSRIAREVMRSTHDVVEYEREEDGRWRVVTTDGHVVKAKPDEALQFLKAYFSMCRNEIAAVDRERGPKSTLRWLRRLGVPDAPVSVVRLRRRQGSETGGGWALTYRYLRRGHWRNQWYGSGEERHQRLIFIAPTVVGPEDGELRARDVVNLLQR
jgi:hypothetical protein